MKKIIFAVLFVFISIHFAYAQNYKPSMKSLPYYPIKEGMVHKYVINTDPIRFFFRSFESVNNDAVIGHKWYIIENKKSLFQKFRMFIDRNGVLTEESWSSDKPDSIWTEVILKYPISKWSKWDGRSSLHFDYQIVEIIPFMRINEKKHIDCVKVKVIPRNPKLARLANTRYFYYSKQFGYIGFSQNGKMTQILVQ